MPRKARFVMPGHLFHLTHRGNNKKNIFLSDQDLRTYLYWFEEAKSKYGMRLLAYCLMPNHVHFIALADHLLSFAKTINAAHMRYARYFNEKYSMVGHLWQGRYYSCLLDGSHLLAAMRYVERNPVRANLVSTPWDWVWSSAQDHLGIDQSILSLENHYAYTSIQSWKEFIAFPDAENDVIEIRKQTQSLRAWAEDSFKDEIKQKYDIDFQFKARGRRNRKNWGRLPIND